MTSVVLEINERKSSGKSLIEYLKSLRKANDYVANVGILETPLSKKLSGIEAAIEDIKMGRITTYKNYEEYEKATNKMLGYV